jgi:type IV pilus biogenesis protein CpaD/CtpE
MKLCLVLLAASTLGCFSRVHMSDNYGRSVHTAFARQVVNPGGAAKAPAMRGLDAQEASLVVETYRKQLAPKGGASTEGSILMLAPNSATGPYMPAPSVPQAH